MTVLAFSPADHDWRARGLCAPDDELWYPHTKAGTAEAQQQIDHAKGVCQVCPVLNQCRADIEATEGNCGRDYRYGIRAGMTPNERHKAYLRKAKAAAAAAAAAA